MTPELWLAVGGLAFTIVTTSVGGVFFLSRQQASRAVGDALLAASVDNLAAEIRKVAEAIEHLDSRVDDHDTRILLLENR